MHFAPRGFTFRWGRGHGALHTCHVPSPVTCLRPPRQWLLLELEETSLLAMAKVSNKSVAELEIAVALHDCPEGYTKVVARTEILRREVTYSLGYAPARFLRINCLKGNPIALWQVLPPTPMFLRPTLPLTLIREEGEGGLARRTSEGGRRGRWRNGLSCQAFMKWDRNRAAKQPGRITFQQKFSPHDIRLKID